MKNVYDVCVLGSGIAGSMMALILARHGARVLMIDRQAHPRFAIGESTIPSTTGCIKVLAERFDVPELKNLTSFRQIRKISSTCGVKRSFSFLYHRDGCETRPDEAMEYRTFPPPLGPDIHLYRQDVDMYVANLARRYGVELREGVGVRDVEIDDLVHLKTTDGQTLQARFLVDATGYRSELAERYGLRDPEPKMRTRSRVIFNHFESVKPYDQVAGPRGRFDGLTRSPFHQSTLHHVFHGGWMWVIPFDNHPESTNPLTSVGVHLDMRLHPDAGGKSPQEEFWSVVQRFPAVARHLEGAVAVRPWVGSGRVQYSSTSAIGDRYCLLPHAAGFVDALFSSGLSISTWGINMLVRPILAALAADDFSRSRFEAYEGMLQRILSHYDALVHGAYVSWRHFELWNAWYRMWTIGAFLQVASELNQLVTGAIEGDEGIFERAPHRGLQAIDYAPYAARFDRCYRRILDVEGGRLEPGSAAAEIHADVIASKLAPRCFSDPRSRSPITATAGNILSLLAWGQYSAESELQQAFFARNPRLLRLMLGEVFDAAWDERGSATSLWRLARDMLSTGNREIAQLPAVTARGLTWEQQP